MEKENIWFLEEKKNREKRKRRKIHGGENNCTAKEKNRGGKEENIWPAKEKKKGSGKGRKYSEKEKVITVKQTDEQHFLL